MFHVKQINPRYCSKIVKHFQKSCVKHKVLRNLGTEEGTEWEEL